MRRGILVLAMITVGCLTWHLRDSFAIDYTAGDLRDPFSDLAPPLTQDKAGEDIPKLISALQLQGIVIGGSEPRAIVDGKIVKAGSKLSIGEVASISKEGVMVSYNGSNYLLKQSEKKAKTK